MATTDPMYGLDMQRVTGKVDSIYVYDTTNNNNAMANSTGLDINFSDLGAFFCGQTR